MVAMEGQLKKRGAKMPVMYDRYCVATWETDQALNKYVLLRSYKNQKNYLQQPGKPLSACTLKCFGDWDGKGNFRRYQHAFLMETREGQVFLCAAPSEAEKTKWLEFMSNASPIPARGESASDLKQLADGGGAGLKLNKRLSMRFMNQALQNQASDVKTARASEDQDESDDSGDESDVRSTTDDEFSLDEHLGLCDCAKSDEPERSPSGSVSSDHDENRNEDESPRVQTPLPVLNVDSSEVLDAYPIASPAHGAHLSDLTDEEEVSMPVDFVQPAAATFKAPTVACAQVVDEITSAQTAQASVKEMSAPVAAPAPASISSPPITRTLSAESRAASPASTADVATRVLEKTEQAAAPLPLPAKKAEAELALLAQQDASGAVVPEIPAPVEAAAVAAASRAIHVFEATADEAAPEPLIPVAIAARAQVPVENSPTPSAVVKIEAVKEKRASDVIAIDAPAVAITTDATPSTPALPLAEEAGGSLSPPPVIAVRAVETMPLEPTTPTARSLSSQQQRMASATPLELGTGSNTNGVVDDDDDSDSQLSSSSSDDGSPSPRRPRGRANSSVVPQSFEPFATPTRLRRYSFSSALAPVRASHAFAIGSPIKQSFLEPHLGYVHSGLSTMVPSFPGLLTSLSRQQSVDEREEFDGDEDQQQGDGDATLHNEDNSAFSTADIDEV